MIKSHEASGCTLTSRASQTWQYSQVIGFNALLAMRFHINLHSPAPLGIVMRHAECELPTVGIILRTHQTHTKHDTSTDKLWHEG